MGLKSAKHLLLKTVVTALLTYEGGGGNRSAGMQGKFTNEVEVGKPYKALILEEVVTGQFE